MFTNEERVVISNTSRIPYSLFHHASIYSNIAQVRLGDRSETLLASRIPYLAHYPSSTLSYFQFACLSVNRLHLCTIVNALHTLSSLPELTTIVV